MKIIAIANQKGGVGKTTTSVNLGACLAEKGQRVIVLDLDPQANSTSALDFTPGEHPSIYQSLIGGGEVADLVVPTKYDNLSIIPCDMDLAGCEIEMAKEDDHLVRLRNLFEPFKATEIADYILIDCPPSLGVLMTSALAAADELIVPLQCEYFGLEGLSKIVGVHQQIRDSGANSEVVLEGIVMTMADSRTNLSAMVINDVREYFPEVTYDTVIPRNIRLGEAPSYGQTVIDYAPTCAGAVAYRALADEFIARHS
ncbi:MAG: ParA family protein [Verrucomicrobiales bacterium]|jgi:chromosome partitioning protein|nr:ParA family protein [Verrucomicrobiales bacterium]